VPKGGEAGRGDREEKQKDTKQFTGGKRANYKAGEEECGCQGPKPGGPITVRSIEKKIRSGPEKIHKGLAKLIVHGPPKRLHREWRHMGRRRETGGPRSR